MNFNMACNVKKNEIFSQSSDKSSCKIEQLQRRKNAYLLAIIPFFILLTITMANTAMAATYYIDAANGNDSGGGSYADPWQTVNKAKTSVYAGDIVNLLPGNYGFVTFNSTDRLGNSGNYITYQTDPDSPAYSAKFSKILFNGNANFYITISGFDVENTGSGDSCINTIDASFINIIDCKAHGQPNGNGPSYANIFCKTSTNILIEGCEVYYSGGWGIGIQLEDSDSITVRNCHVHDIVGSGIRTGGGQNYTIDNNIVHDQREEWNPDVHGSGISIHSHDTTISNNIIYNYGNTRPIRFYQSFAGSNGYRNMLVENNLVYKTPDFTGKMWWVEFLDVGPNVVIRNNTFTDSMIIVLATNANGSGLTLYNNIVGVTAEISNKSGTGGNSNWNNVTEGGNCFRWLAAATGGYKTEYSQFTSASDSIIGQAVSYATTAAHYPYNNDGPYQLTANSIATDQGNSNYAPDRDLLQNIRTNSPEAGCYEYGSEPGTPPANNSPVANAGQNQTVTDDDNDGTEQITLDGFGSTDSDGTIISYIWKENNNQIASGINPTVSLATGQHTITLIVTDDMDATDTDTVSISIETDAVDSTPPAALSFTPSANSLDIIFTEALDTASAENINNYHIDPGVSITHASLNSAANIVTLTTSTHALDYIYTLTCSGISDTSGNVAAPITKNYIYSPNLVGFWHFDEGNGSTAEDLSSKQNTGDLVNGPLWTAFEALDFDGIDDHVACGNDQSLNITGDLTISACVNLASFGQNGWGRIVDKGNGSNGFSFFVEEATGSIAYVVYGGNIVKSNPGIVQLNKWQHVTAVFNNSAKTVTFYLDGENAGSSSYAIAPASSSSSQLVIGIRDYDSNRAFDGQIDSVRVYNKALNDQNVFDIYSSDYPVAFYPINDKTIDEDSTLSFEVKTIDDNLNVQLQTHDLPSEPQFLNNVFDWTPARGNAGSYQATFYATQGQIEDFETITITVNSINSSPIFDATTDKSVNENQTLTFTVNATDTDNDPITYSAAGLPNGATLTGNAFNWMPKIGQAGSYQITFIAADGYETVSQAVNITVDPAPANSNETIIGNGDPQTAYTGAWTASAGSDPYGNGSVWGRDGDTYTWTFTPATSGIYDVAMWWSGWSSRSNSVQVAIEDMSGTDTVYIDQSNNAGKWNSLDAYSFQAGNSYTVTITASAAPASTCADAVKFTFIENLPAPEPEPEVIIDNGDSQTSYTGSWKKSGGTSPYGDGSVWARKGVTYTWTFTPSASGQYDLSMWWSGWKSRSDNALVAIEDMSGTDTLYIDQSKNAGMWNSLAACNFQAGNSYRVTITASDGSSSTCADAVKFTFVNNLP